MTNGKTFFVAVVLSVLAAGCVEVPASQTPGPEMSVFTLDQGWSEEQRALFYHQSQGTIILPRSWFMAIEQPEIKFVGEVGLFRANDYISRFGFLQGQQVPTTSGASGPGSGATEQCGPGADYLCGLPVGFARTTVRMPGTNDFKDVVGISCAGCHVTELHFQDKAIRIDGATAMMDVTQFQTALGGAMFLTQRLPFRFNRFAERVIRSESGRVPEDDGYDAAYDQLRADLDEFMAAAAPETQNAISKRLYSPYPGGFGRTDALARITNMVFATEMDNPDNLVVGSAPVKYPAIWDAPYFAWAQYNGSIEQSMVRNVGEALGVKARIKYIASADAPMWAGERTYKVDSTVDVPGLYAFETLLRGVGDDYFNGLSSPIWPEEHLGAIDWDGARAGQLLYDSNCRPCHLPPTADLVERRMVDGRDLLAPRGRDVILRKLTPSDVTLDEQIIGKVLPVPLTDTFDTTPISFGDLPDKGWAMYWISNNHPEMLGDWVPRPFDQVEFFINLGGVNLGSIRTDPGQAANFARNIIDTKEILLPEVPRYDLVGRPLMQFPQRVVPAGIGLQMVTINITNSFYDQVDAQGREDRNRFIAGLPWNLRDETGEPRQGLFLGDRYSNVNRAEWDGYRAPGAVVPPQYRPHPLNGIWASPPYLHNGSIPNIYALLSPYDERPETFYVGNRAYDPRNVGYQSGRFRGAFKYDTSVTGNSNYGHMFDSERGTGDGVIGAELSPSERLFIIEFLKTLCPPGKRTDYSRGNENLCAPLPPAGR